MIYCKNLCNQCFCEQLQLSSYNEDKPTLMLFKMDENVTKDRLWSGKISAELLAESSNGKLSLLSAKLQKVN